MDQPKINVAPDEDASFEVKFIDPASVIDQLEIENTDQVADFGCGTGYFVFPVAQKVIGGGRVYALDIMIPKLESVQSQARLLRMNNIVIKRVNLEKIGGSKLSDGEMDWVILVDMLFQNKDKKVILEEAKRVLKEKGKILVIEWNPQDSSVGPESNLRISKEALLETAQEVGLGLFKEIRVSDFHYGLILIK